MTTSYDVLFLGHKNAARSIMAEAILNRDGQGRFRVWSAGIAAGTGLDPKAVELLERMHFDLARAYPKNWSELAGEEAPQFDFIFTVCDHAALLPQASWTGQPTFAHWGVPDPAAVQGNVAETRLAYADTFRMLANRIGIFINLPLKSLDAIAMQRQLNLIGSQGRTAAAAAA